MVGLIGFGAVTILWPNNDKLPILGTITDYEFEDVFTGNYNFTNDKVKVTTFFYTRCPDICPLTMSDFTHLQNELKQANIFGQDVELVSISFDPKHDTTEVLQRYANNFQSDSDGWKWLRGTTEKTEQLAGELKVQFKKIDATFYSHSTTMFLIDQNNNIRALYDMAYQSKPVDKQKIIEDIRYLVGKK